MDTKTIKARMLRQSERLPAFTNANLAKLIGVSERTIRRYFDENDHLLPGLMDMVAICEHFNLSMDLMLFPGGFFENHVACRGMVAKASVTAAERSRDRRLAGFRLKMHALARTRITRLMSNTTQRQLSSQL